MTSSIGGVPLGPGWPGRAAIVRRPKQGLGGVLPILGHSECVLNFSPVASVQLRITKQPYPSDVSDAEWAFGLPSLCLLPEDTARRVSNLRDIFDDLRCTVRTGSTWRSLPKDFPPWEMVYQQGCRWRLRGTRSCALPQAERDASGESVELALVDHGYTGIEQTPRPEIDRPKIFVRLAENRGFEMQATQASSTPDGPGERSRGKSERVGNLRGSDSFERVRTFHRLRTTQAHLRFNS